ncbi:hypothetical protein ACWDRR_00820 [Kitasatospora sp. NPDC003701]
MSRELPPPPADEAQEKDDQAEPKSHLEPVVESLTLRRLQRASHAINARHRWAQSFMSPS